MKTGTDILKEIMASFTSENFLEYTRIGTDASKDFYRLTHVYWHDYFLCGKKVSVLKKDCSLMQLKDLYAIELDEKDGFNYEYLKTKGIFNQPYPYPLPIVKDLLTIIKELSLKGKVIEKNGFIDEKDILLVNFIDGGKTYGPVYSLMPKKYIEEFFEQSEESFNRNLKPKMEYFIETPILFFRFPYSSGLGYGNHYSLSHEFYWERCPMAFSIQRIQQKNNNIGLDDVGELKRVLEQSAKIFSILNDHQESIFELERFYKELDTMVYTRRHEEQLK